MNPAGSSRLKVTSRSLSGNPRHRPRWRGSSVNRTSPRLDPLTSHRPRQPWAPQAHTRPVVGVTWTIAERSMSAANSQPPTPIDTWIRSAKTATRQWAGPASSGIVSARIHRLKEMVNSVELSEIGMRPSV